MSDAQTREKQTQWRWRIFLVTWLAYAGYYLTRKSFSAAKPALKEMGFSKPQMAGIDTAYNAAYAAGQFVFGIAGDRIGTRRVILSGMFVSLLLGAAMGFSRTALAFGILMCLQGIVQATGWAPLAKNVGNFFGQRERGLIMGLWCTNYALGGVIATGVAGTAGARWGWPFAFFVPAAALLAVWALFLLFQRDRPEDVGLPAMEDEGPGRAGDDASGKTSWREIREVALNPMVLLLCAVYFCIKPVRYLFLQWGPLYLNERLGTDLAASALLSTTFEIGGPLGALVGGWISDRFLGSRRVPVCVICLMGLALCLMAFGKLPATRAAIGAMLFTMGAFTYAADSLVNGTAAVDFGSRRGASTAAGVINGVGSLGQIIGGALPALVGEKPADWNPLFLALAVGAAFAGVILLPKWNAVPSRAAQGG